MKKFFKSKGFLAAALSASCIGILAACWLSTRDTESSFQPDEPQPSAVAAEWKDTPAPAKTPAGNRADACIPAQAKTGQDLEAYPKVVEESAQEVIIDFLPAADTETTPEPPAPPVAEGGTDNPASPPSYAPEDLEPEPTGLPRDDTPAAGSSNGNGAVYDPVFGWVIPGKVNQINMDSSGDPNKMVGNM
ncbi:MAG: hypothetical protein NC331_06455 [Lachnospiraceae bacterium]|nr:hypothetical protein [Lachnospiraceae bacterium]MCM1239012.1 hypothetical protein [Lachnospiraceae bacterium]